MAVEASPDLNPIEYAHPVKIYFSNRGLDPSNYSIVYFFVQFCSMPLNSYNLIRYVVDNFPKLTF